MRREEQTGRWQFWLACFAIVLLAGTSVRAEGEVRNFAPTGVFPARENDWVAAGFWVNNQTLEPFEGTYVATVDGLRGVEFSADIWVPTMARRGGPLMMHVGPKPTRAGKGTSDDMASTNVPYSTNSSLLSKGGKQLIKADKGFILQSRAAASMMMFGDGDDDPIEMGNVMAKLMGGTAAVQAVPKHFRAVVDYPSGGMLGVTHVLLGSQSSNVEVRRLEALRDWVIAGGKLMVLETRTSPELLRMTLGDAWNVERVDTREVASLPGWNDRSRPAAFGRAMSMDRVVMDESWRPLWSMGQWPLAARRSLGRGEVYAVMVEPAAFIKTSSGVGPGVEDLASSLGTAFLGTPPLQMDTGSMHGIAQSQIGYRVVSRQTVGVVLGLFCVGVIAGGFILHRKGQAAIAAATVCGLAILGGIVVVGLGLTTRGAVPPTLSCMSMATPVEESHAMLMEGVGEFYVPVKTTADISPARGISVWPEGGMQAGASARLVTDGDTLRWSQVALSAGTATKTRINGVLPVKDVPSFKGTVNEEGFAGTISGGSVGKPEDAVIRVADGYRVIGDGGKVSLPYEGGKSMLVYKAEGGSTEARLAHLKYLEKLFGKTTGPALVGAGTAPPGVVAFAWADASESATPVNLADLGGKVAYKHEMLMALPLKLERPAAGARVAIPSDLLIMDIEGLGTAAPPLDMQTRQWVSDLTLDKMFLARFRVPAEVSPLRVEKAEALVRIDAPSWKVEILDENSKPLAAKTSPVSGDLWKVEVPVKAGAVDRVAYRVRLSNPDPTAAGKAWAVRSVGMRLKGVVGDGHTR